MHEGLTLSAPRRTVYVMACLWTLKISPKSRIVGHKKPCFQHCAVIWSWLFLWKSEWRMNCGKLTKVCLTKNPNFHKKAIHLIFFECLTLCGYQSDYERIKHNLKRILLWIVYMFYTLHTLHMSRKYCPEDLNSYTPRTGIQTSQNPDKDGINSLPC